MTIHYAHVIALAAVLVGISALGPLAACTGAEQPLEDSGAVAEQGDAGAHAEEQTLDELRALAEQGDAEAQFNLGLVYREGRGATVDVGEADRWWRRAAEQGHVDAQYRLGLMYRIAAFAREAAPDAPGARPSWGASPQPAGLRGGREVAPPGGRPGTRGCPE